MLYIVTPVGNEETAIRSYIDSIEALGMELRLVLVIDTFSKDGTRGIIEEISNSKPWVELLDIGQGKGIASAYLSGLKHAMKMEATKAIEVDVGHPVHLIPEFSKALDKYHVVFASRYLKGAGYRGPMLRRLISFGGTIISRWFLCMPFTDCTSGYQGYQLAVLKKLPYDSFMSKGHIYQTEMKYYCSGLDCIEMPLKYESSATSLSWKSVVEALWVSLRLRSRLPVVVNRMDENVLIRKSTDEILSQIAANVRVLRNVPWVFRSASTNSMYRETMDLLLELLRRIDKGNLNESPSSQVQQGH